MGRAEARSAGINRPAGVARSFQVSLYKVEPTEAVLARNLLAKDDWRAADRDEVVESRPKVPLVSKPRAFACRAERLARAGSGPDGPLVVPSGPAEGVGPDADPGEEVALVIGSKVIWCHILDAAFVHVAGGDVTLLDQFPQPGRSFGVELVVIDRHQCCTNTIGVSPAQHSPRAPQ